jgi:glycosyltransferase involved in cell wall biosynthesis
MKYVHEIADLRDDELARLIHGARALLAPSAAEGFDLPVVEALALSTPVIASDIPAHRELAHGALLLDATDGPGWLREISAAAARPRKRGPPFQAPTWQDHFEIVRRALFQQAPPDPGGAGELELPRIRQG